MTSANKAHDTEKNEARLKGISLEVQGEQEELFSEKREEQSQEFVACQASLKEWQEKYVRLSADFENFKRRMEKEQQQWRDMAQADLLLKILSITDNFDRAMEHKDQQSVDEFSSWAEGIAMIHGALSEFLKGVGVTEVSYEKFDPLYHDALMQVESGEHEPGSIVTIMEKGYLFNGRVLRPAKVSVAR